VYNNPMPNTIKNVVPVEPNVTFFGLGIAPKILEILDKNKFKVPTPIQFKAIPIGLEGKDIMGIAQTGTGKTLAFAIPVIQRLAQKAGNCMVLVPTRELALQVDETFRKIAPYFKMNTAVLIGGAPMEPQVRQLRANPRVIIATPGRLLDHMGQWNVMPNEVNILVVDEADRMLDMGFAPQIEKILKFLPKDRQTMLFSATMPQTILKIASSHMKLPVSVEIARSGTTAEGVIQELFIVQKEAKKRLLTKILQQYHGSVLLFSRTKFGAKKITRGLRDSGISAAEIHSDRSLAQRKDALDGFKAGRHRVLVATDIAARGIDVNNIELVINYDIPEDPENYVHRIGRTGRAGAKGRAISFAMPDQAEDVRNIEKLIQIPLPIKKLPDFPEETFIQGSSSAASRSKARQQHQHHHGNRNQHGQHKPQKSFFKKSSGRRF